MIALVALAACEQVERAASTALPSRKAIAEVPHRGDRADAPPLEQRGNAQFSDARYDDSGTLLLTVGEIGSSGRLLVWNATTGALVSAFDAIVPSRGSRNHWMIDSKRKRLLARRGADDAHALFDLMTGEMISVIEDTDDGAGGKTKPPPAFREPYPVGLVGDQSQVLIFKPGVVQLWDLDPPKLAKSVPSPFTEQRFFPACTGGTPGSTYTDKQCWELSDDGRTLAVAFTPDDPVDAYTQYMLIDTASLEIERLAMPESSHGHSFKSFALSPDNRWLAVGNSEGFWLYDRPARAWTRWTAGQEHRSNALAPMRFTADSKRLIALGDQLQLNAFDVESGALIGRHNQPFGDYEGEIKISADGSRVVIYKFLPDILEIFDGATMQRLGWVCPYFCNVMHNPIQPGYAVSPDGASVAVSHRRGVAVWDTAMDRLRVPLHDSKRKPLPYPRQQ